MLTTTLPRVSFSDTVAIPPTVNFINILLRTIFLYERCFGSFFYIHVTREKLLKRHSYEKCTKNDDEIDTWRCNALFENGPLFQMIDFNGGQLTLLVHCLHWMLPLNHNRTTISLAPPIFCVAKKLAIKR